MKGRIFYEGKEFYFRNLRSLTIQAGGKAWVLNGNPTETELRFKPAPMGGQAGLGNYIKQWRKRSKLTQAEAAREFGLSQSMIAKIENETRDMPGEVFLRIKRDNLRNYGRE